MKFYTATLAATSALCLSMGMAHAADPNTLYIHQDGIGNSANIEQDIVGFPGDNAGGNDFGTPGDHALQHGNNNHMDYSNGTANYHSNLSAGNNDVVDAKQIGDSNKMYFANQSVGSSGDTSSSDNVITSAQQHGNENQLHITRQNADDGAVTTALQSGNANHMRVVQKNGDRNSVGTVSQVGSNNGYNSYGNNDIGTYIEQGGGDDNRVDEASVVGSNNGGLSNRVGIWIQQDGSNNGANSSTAQIFGDYNQIRVTQFGDSNDFLVQQGNSLVPGSYNLATLAQTGSYNAGTIVQDGSDNTAHAVQTGDGNFIDAEQTGNDNMITASFVGDYNGVGSFTPKLAGSAHPKNARSLADSSSHLTQGMMFQDSSGPLSGNTINYTVTGSNNLFAFAQIGGGNTINATVGTVGLGSSGNEAAVLQTGMGNNSTFSQTGGGSNNIAVSQ